MGWAALLLRDYYIRGMKNALPALLLCLWAVPAISCAQSVPMNGANQVVIQTPDSAAVALKKLAVAFVGQGYTVDKFDAQFLTLTFAPKTLTTPFNPIVFVRASAGPGANSTLRVSGEYRAVVMRHELNGLLEIKGSEKGVGTSGFREMQKVALTYPNGQVSYAKQ